MFKPEAADGGGRTHSTLAEINIIPFVDVVLVLLLIFMLTAPMMYRGIDVNLPKASAKPTAVEERMVLTVTKDKTLYLNEKPVPAASWIDCRLMSRTTGALRKTTPPVPRRLMK